jgi:PAS domain S-box-containing protein
MNSSLMAVTPLNVELKPRILVIDDTQAIHDDFRKILGGGSRIENDLDTEAVLGIKRIVRPRAEFAIDCASQGIEGLALVQSACQQGRPYAIAFVDVRMPPGWDGIESTEKLWSIDPNLQVVLCTAYSDYSWEDIVERLGATDNLVILKKPFDKVEVLQLAHALAKKWQLARRAKAQLADLGAMVDQRTEESQGFCELGHRLSSARTAKEAARIIVDVADRLLGWDACFCKLQLSDAAYLDVLNIDVVNGQRAECAPGKARGLSTVAQKAIREGGQLVLKDPALPLDLAFGDTSRPSASLLFVPIRNGAKAIGVLSIRSYTPNTYDQHSLELLQALADHCGGAMDRIRGQETLLETEARLHHVVAQSPAVLYSLKPQNGRFVLAWISDNVTQLFGITPEEVLHAGHWPLNPHPADKRALETAAAQLFKHQRAAAEYRFLDQSGKYRWLRDEQRLLPGSGGQPSEIVGTSMDITERKQLEEQLRHSQKMEAIGQLAGGVAHDFNNLLAAIRGNTELLLMNPGQFNPEATDCLNQVVAASDRAAGLTRQLLTFSRKQVMQPQPLNLSDVVANLTKMLRRIIGEAIQLRSSGAPRLPLVRADVGMIEQVLVNLVVNARDAMPDGGQLLVHVEPVSLAEAEVPGHPDARAGLFVCLSVTDSGSGIPAEHLSRIFEPFFTTKEPGKGTGLGLATAYGIVKQHQGWIEVSSRLGQGSTFKVFLPVSETQRRDAKPATEPEPVRGTETILLVEDDEAVRTLTRRVLENFGYRVIAAASGSEALDLCGHQLDTIDLLLTDIIMPNGVNGRQLAQQLLARRPALKIIFMTGYDGEALGPETSFIEQIQSRLLHKPCSWREMLHAIRQTLDCPQPVAAACNT